MNDQEAVQAAFNWHPECRDAYLRGALDGEAGGHFAVHAAVEGMLSGNPQFRDISDTAVQVGVDPHEIRHCLGRVLLEGMWQFTHKGTVYDKGVIAKRFKEEVTKVPGGTGFPRIARDGQNRCRAW